MASSAKLFRRIGAALGHGASGAALGHGASGARECACRVLKELPPPGYVLNSSGLLVPKTMVNGSVRRLSLNFVESPVLETMERASGLFFRFTKVMVSTGACFFVLKLTWREATENGRLQHYLPGPKENIDNASSIPIESTPGYLEVKTIVEEVNQQKLAEFSEGCIQAIKTGNLLVYIDAIVVEQKLTLVGKGVPADYIAHSQEIFFAQLRDVAKNSMRQLFRVKHETPVKERGEEGQPSK